ncbi:MAG: helix-turn-helix domain-containing protein [Chitinophagaceae bacterium]|nr:helix-turn-helix domain-containing protein [Chitinophagaceae bacterium]
MTPDNIILEEYREVFRKYAADGIIDLDKRLKRKFNFRIYLLEEFLSALGGVLPLTRLSQHYVSLITAGKGEKTIGRFRFALQKNTFFVIPARVPHSSIYEPGPFAGYSVSFNMDFFLQAVFPVKHLVDRKLFKASHIPFVMLNEEQAAKVTAIFKNLVEEYNADRINKAELLAVKTLELLIICDRFCGNAGKEPVHPSGGLVDRFRELVQRYFLRERSVGFYADKLHVHANYLNSVVKRQTGITAKEMINDHILLEAKTMLSTSPMSVKQIAYELGFDEPDLFSAFFRRRLHVSPLRYRQQHLI